jgi:3-oxoacyl-[acyl-carrier-protein] synthase-3
MAAASQRSPSWSASVALAVRGTGQALPGEPISTAELLHHIAAHYGVDVRRKGAALARALGIATRHICRPLLRRVEGPRPGCTNAELAAQAVRQGLDRAGAQVRDLSYLVAHTATPGQLVPPNVARVAQLLGYTGPFAEIRQACTGFANALVFANGLVAHSGCGLVAIVGSETGSVYFDPLTADRDAGQLVNLVQMGDAAAAVIVGAPQGADPRITALFYGSTPERPGQGLHLVGGSDAPTNGLPYFEHNFRPIRRHGPALFEQSVAAARALDIELRQVDYLIPPQVNGHIARLTAHHLGIPVQHVFGNAARVGNTGSAAIWLAFDELRSRLSAGQSVLALGAEATAYMFGGFHYVH